jgi:hypothetical protein
MEQNWGQYEKVFVARRSGLTLHDAGATVGVSRERARQIEARSIMAIVTGQALTHLAPLTEREMKIALRYFPRLVKSSD